EIDSESVRSNVMSGITRRFGYLGWGSLVILLVTGIGNTFQRQSDLEFFGRDVFDFDYRYAWLLTAKLVLVAIVVVLTAWHSFVLGPRMLDEQRDGAPAEDQASLRRLSIIVSAANLVILLAIVYLVTLMQDPDFSSEEV
ncbi:MAG TPA: CopD family protein, partial [Dehalococcoidia bacterium]|nr:CopD family protein [Dehalococcoidia bacterium]